MGDVPFLAGTWLPIPAAAKQLGIPRRSVLRWATRGAVEARVLGNVHLVELGSLRAVAASRAEARHAGVLLPLTSRVKDLHRADRNPSPASPPPGGKGGRVADLEEVVGALLEEVEALSLRVSDLENQAALP